MVAFNRQEKLGLLLQAGKLKPKGENLMPVHFVFEENSLKEFI